MSATPIPANQASFALSEIVTATGGALRTGEGDHRVTGVAIDSRAIRGGELFVAIAGASHDGHRFVPSAVESGAAAVLVKSGTATPPGVGVVEVPDTERALGDLAAAHRRRWSGCLVAITGSAGKTSTKELTAAVLTAAGLRVHKTRGNLNNLIGVPMTLFCLTPDSELSVLELGTNRPGEIARLAELARPDVGVVTLVAAAHTEGLGTIESVAQEKAALLMAVPEEGVAVANGDDEVLRPWLDKCAAKSRVLFGREPHCDVRLVSWTVRPDLRTDVRFEVVERAIEARMSLLGEGAALNGAAALAVAVACGADVDRAAAGLASVEPTSGRMRPLVADRDVLVLDDAYNANPRSMRLALDTARECARVRGGRLVAALGDMRELGPTSSEHHRSVGMYAAQVGVAELVGVGPEMVAATDAAREAGVSSHAVPSPEEAVKVVEGLLDPKDVLLVKGSNASRMHVVVGAFAGKEALR